MRFPSIRAVAAFAAIATSASVVVASPAQKGSAYDFAFQSIDGTDLPMSSFKGKAVLVVNTASLCGFTRQYQGLQTLYERYKDRGLVVVGVPANDFGRQEPKSNAEIKSFCQGAFGVTFPLTEKVAVTGDKIHPFYRWARDVLGRDAAPRWNFHKYLVGRDGRLIAAFQTTVRPTAASLTSAIEAELDRTADTADTTGEAGSGQAVSG